MSQHIAHLKPGETLSFKGPIAKYVYKPNEFAHGFAIGGGSGITPMYQMITHSLELPGDNTKWTLMYANVTDKDIRKSSTYTCRNNQKLILGPISSSAQGTMGQTRQAAPG
jgi:NAD(P)H-flavin reductase